MWIGYSDCRGSSDERRARWGGPWESFGEFWGAKGPRRGRAGRMFEQGDLKLVILRLLEEKPRHGYEIIKELETRSAGAYSPSPGTIYPTLTMLEDMGYARAVPEEGGKKIYQITDEGRKHLAEHSSTVNDVFDRILKFAEGFTDSAMMDVNNAFRNVAKATYSTATSHLQDKDRLAKIKGILERASAEIDALGKPGP
jgi:DNA-binding PadR family transcriptional regulator